MANKRQAKKAETRRVLPEPEDIKIEFDADVTHPAAPAVVADPVADLKEAPRRKIRVITNPPEETRPQTTMGRAIRPFARPAQSGTFSPFAVSQARRGH
jgi:hypothetical protein